LILEEREVTEIVAVNAVYTRNCWRSENNTKCRWTWNEADISWMSCTLK